MVCVLSTIGNSTHPPEEPNMTASSTRRTTAAHHRLAAVGAIAVAGTLVLTGCGDQTDKGSSSSGTSSSSAPLASKLPADIRKAGVIRVGSDIAYPATFLVGSTVAEEVIGDNADLPSVSEPDGWHAPGQLGDHHVEAPSCWVVVIASA